MKTRRSRCSSLRAYTFSPASPPRELQLWDVGANPTDYGVHLWTARSAREVMACYASRGNPLQIDVEHNNAEPGEPGPAGGYARLELRGGAPWLVFDWSAYAVGQIETRQRLFLSPEYDVDQATSEIVRLVRVSLVGDPGTHHARMLARIAAAADTQGDSSMKLALILAALKAANAAEDPEVARAGVEKLIAEIENAAGANGGADGADPPAATTEKQAGAEYEAGAEGDGGLDGAGNEDPKKKPPQQAAADPMKCGASPSEIALATRIAQLEADARRRDTREAELEARARVSAAGERIPESLRAFAAKLTKTDFDTFVNGIPLAVPGTKSGGVRASAKPTRGLADKRPAGELPEDTRRHLARAFGSDDRGEQSVTELPDGRMRATHIVRRPAVATGKA